MRGRSVKARTTTLLEGRDTALNESTASNASSTSTATAKYPEVPAGYQEPVLVTMEGVTHIACIIKEGFDDGRVCEYIRLCGDYEWSSAEPWFGGYSNVSCMGCVVASTGFSADEISCLPPS